MVVATGGRIGRIVLALALLTAACGGPDHSASDTTTSDGAGASISAPGAASFAETADPTAAARQEYDLVRQLREETGMLTLLGNDATPLFDGLEAIQTEFAQDLLGDLAEAVESGTPPDARLSPAGGLTASLVEVAMAPAVVPQRFEPSLLAHTGFTTVAFLAILTGMIHTASEDGDWTLPREDRSEQTIDGLIHKVELRTTVHAAKGGGRVSVDVTLTAVDNVFRTDGSFVAMYTSNSSGHFDVKGCPDSNAIAEGTYSFTTRHELNNLETGTNAQSAGGRSVQTATPFWLINGEDAYLQRIEATLNLEADSRGPNGSWNASQPFGFVMPVRGDTTISPGAMTGNAGDRAIGSMLLSAGMTQLFLGQVGKEAEGYWRSGECIELIPSHDSRDVAPEEQISLTVEAQEAFGTGSIEKPIVATFSGLASLSPTDTPEPAPATFRFGAGSEEGDRGIITLRQTSIRGIGKRTVEYVVKPQGLVISIEGIYTSTGQVTDIEVARVDDVTLSQGDDGVFRGSGTLAIEFTTNWAPGDRGGACSGSYQASFPLDIALRPDETDPNQLLPVFGWPFIEIPYTLQCTGFTLEGEGYAPPLALDPILESTPMTIGVNSFSSSIGGLGGQSDVTVTISREEAPTG